MTVSWVVGVGYVPTVEALALEAAGHTVYHYWKSDEGRY